MKTIRLYLLLFCLGWCLIGCGKLSLGNLTQKDQIEPALDTPIVKPVAFNNPAGKLSEVAPPAIARKLAELDDRSPQLEFIAPERDRILKTANVEVKLKLEDFAPFRDENLGLGPHVKLILDNQPAQQLYSLDEPIVLENLAPGTHTLRAFAVLPWDESYKNQEAFALTTFHILTKTYNNPDRDRPLLTYNSPEGVYGAEPILLDFYLSNAPLHVIARESPDDDIKDWRIRVTINGESFILEDWQPIYLTGFERGNNWVQLELLDEEGNNLENAFNNTVRLVTYNPQASDPLAKLIKEQISVADARSIIEPKSKLETQPVVVPEVVEPEPRKEEIESSEAEPAIAPPESPAVEAETETDTTEVSPPETSDTEAAIKIEPKTSNVEIVEIEEPATERSEAKIEAARESEIEPETDSNITSIEIIETDDKSVAEKPIAEIELPQTESVEIAEVEPAIESAEPETPAKPKLKTPEWLKNLWSNLRQTIQGITKRLPSREQVSETR